ncbi:MAG: 2Fe-2S iron-sulfur cluster binding domain-containing protein [Spirochaetales bacterium]|nr:2Fe-2S iron-sulfur cluster binding domain-containing protein [Spirochaetales bacterium]
MIIEFNLNEKAVNINVPPQKRLVDILREEFNLFSIHHECGEGLCGRCTILMNDKLTYSCLIPAFKAKGKNVATYEWFQESEGYQDITKGFKYAGCYPCRHCESTRMLAAHTLLETSFRPSQEEIANFMSFITCGCIDFTTLFSGLIEAGRIREERVHER